MDIQECKAAGWYFGLSNLGNAPETSDNGNAHNRFIHPHVLIQKHGEDCWHEIIAGYNRFLEGQMDSEEMYDGALAEIDHWIEQMENGDTFLSSRWSAIKSGTAYNYYRCNRCRFGWKRAQGKSSTIGC